MKKILYFGFAEDADWLQLRDRNLVRNRNRNLNPAPNRNRTSIM